MLLRLWHWLLWLRVFSRRSVSALADLAAADNSRGKARAIMSPSSEFGMLAAALAAPDPLLLSLLRTLRMLLQCEFLFP